MTEPTITSELVLPISRAIVKTADSAARMINAQTMEDCQTDEYTDVFVSDLTWLYARCQSVLGIDAYPLNRDDDDERYLLDTIYDYVRTFPDDRGECYIDEGARLYQRLVHAILDLGHHSNQPGMVL